MNWLAFTTGVISGALPVLALVALDWTGYWEKRRGRKLLSRAKEVSAYLHTTIGAPKLQHTFGAVWVVVQGDFEITVTVKYGVAKPSGDVRVSRRPTSNHLGMYMSDSADIRLEDSDYLLKVEEFLSR